MRAPPPQLQTSLFSFRLSRRLINQNFEGTDFCITSWRISNQSLTALLFIGLLDTSQACTNSIFELPRELRDTTSTYPDLLVRFIVPSYHTMSPSTTKQWTVQGQNGFDSLKFNEKAEVPQLGENDVLVHFFAASLNYRDLIIPKVRNHGVEVSVYFGY